MKLEKIAVINNLIDGGYWDDTSNKFESFYRASEFTPDSTALKQSVARALEHTIAVEIKIIYVDDDRVRMM